MRGWWVDAGALDLVAARPQLRAVSGAEWLTYGKWVLFFGVPLGLGFFELWRLKRLERDAD